MVDRLPEHEFSYPGERFRNVYTPKIEKDGTVKLTVSGKEDLKELYNSYRDEYDPNVLIARYQAGDLTALQRGNPVFMDCLSMPKSLAEAYELNFRAERCFENLPAEIKEKFGNSYFQFISDAGSDSWFDALQIKNDPIKDDGSAKESDPVNA